MSVLTEVPSTLADLFKTGDVATEIVAERERIALEVFALAPGVEQHEHDTRSAKERVYQPFAVLNIDLRQTYTRKVGKKSAPDYFAQTNACREAISAMYLAAFPDDGIRESVMSNVRNYTDAVIAERATTPQLTVLGKTKTQQAKKEAAAKEQREARDAARTAVVTATGAPERQAAAVVTLTQASEDKFGLEERLSVVEQLLGDLANRASTTEQPVLDAPDDGDMGWATAGLRESLAVCLKRLDAIETLIADAEEAEAANVAAKAAAESNGSPAELATA